MKEAQPRLHGAFAVVTDLSSSRLTFRSVRSYLWASAAVLMKGMRRTFARVAPSPPSQQTNHLAFNLIFTAAVVIAGLYYSLTAAIYLDDAFIYFRTVEQFLAGHGPVLNPGDQHTAATSPLWLLVLSALKLVFGDDFLLATKAATVLLYALAAYFLAAILRPQLGAYAALAPFAVFFTPLADKLVGLETALIVATVLAALWAWFVQRHLPLAGLFVSLAYLARGEGAFVAIPIALAVLLHALPSRGSLSLRHTLTRRLAEPDALASIAAALLPAAVWHAYLAATLGTLLPSTLSAKIAQGTSGIWPTYASGLPEHLALGFNASPTFSLSEITKHLQTNSDPSLWLLLLAGLGLVSAAGALWPLILFFTLHFSTYAALQVSYFPWYYYCLDLILRVSLLVGAIQVWRALAVAVTRPLHNYRLWPRSRLTGSIAPGLALIALVTWRSAGTDLLADNSPSASLTDQWLC